MGKIILSVPLGKRIDRDMKQKWGMHVNFHSYFRVILWKEQLLVLKYRLYQGRMPSFLPRSMAWVLRFTSIFPKILEECVLTVFKDTNRREAISRLLSP